MTPISQQAGSLHCEDGFNSLMYKQHNYFQSADVQALKLIGFKKETVQSDSEVEQVQTGSSHNQSRIEVNIQSSYQKNELKGQKREEQDGFEKTERIQINIENQEQNNSANQLKDPQTTYRQSFNQKQMRSDFQYSIDQDSNILAGESSTHNLRKASAKTCKQTEDQEGEKGSRRLNYFRPMKGVGNIFRFLGIIQPKMKRFFFTKTVSGKTRSLTQTIRTTLNDLADYDTRMEIVSQKDQIMNLILIFLEKIYLFLMIDKIPIFNPENVLKIWFNSIIVCYNCFYLLIRSLMIFFRADFGVYYTYFHYIAEACWVIEMIVQMNTSMYHHNHFTKDRKVIMKIYLKEYFFFEILPLIFDGMKSENIMINVLIKLPLLLKIKGISIILKNLEFYVLQLLDNHSFFFLLKLILQMMLFGHSMACAFSVVTTYQINYMLEETVWQSRYETSESWEGRYQQSLYWAFTTMMNVYNFSPTSNLELGFTCVCMLVSCVAFGYLISSIGGILNDLNKEQKEYKKDLNILNQFMKRKQIEIGLVRKANIHLKKFYLQQRRIRFNEENETLMKLNEDMKKELLISANWKALKQCEFFFNIFSNTTLQKLCTLMTEKLFTPGQLVFDRTIQEVSSDSFLYLIMSGSVRIQDEFQKTISEEKKVENKYRFLKSIIKPDKLEGEQNNVPERQQIGRSKRQGEYFGVEGFFTGRETIFKVVSQEFSQIMVISKNDFLRIVTEEKADFERYKEISDKIKFSNDFSDTKTNCSSCLSYYHDTYQCPKVYFDKDKVYTALKSNFSFNQERACAVRGNKKSQNALQFTEKMEREAFLIQLDYGLQSITNPLSLSDDSRFESENDIDSATENEIIQQKPLGNQFDKYKDDHNIIEEYKHELPQIIESKYVCLIYYFFQVEGGGEINEINKQNFQKINENQEFKMSQQSFFYYSAFEKEIGFIESNCIIPQLGLIAEDEGENDATQVNGYPQINTNNSLLSPQEWISHNQQMSPFKKRLSVEANLGINIPSQQRASIIIQPKQKQDIILKNILDGLQKLLGTTSQIRAQLPKRKQSSHNIQIGEGFGRMPSNISRTKISHDDAEFNNSQITSQKIIKPGGNILSSNNINKAMKVSQTVNFARQSQDLDISQRLKLGEHLGLQRYPSVVQKSFGNISIEFDRMHIYQNYFPFSNAPEIIQSNNAVLIKNRKRKLKRLRNNSSYSRTISMKSKNKDFNTNKSFVQHDNH